MKIKDNLRITGEILRKSGTPDARLEAEVLLRHVLSIDRTKLFTDLENEISNIEEVKIEELIQRRLNHEPLSYITGHREFYGMDFYVSPDVLIPRPETELLVDNVIEISKMSKNPTIAVADVGTGSGAIAISIAYMLPLSKVIAIDISSEALRIADKNRRNHGLYTRVSLKLGNLLDPIVGQLDCIVSNLPYLPTSWLSTLQAEIQREPMIALDGGSDGLQQIRKLLTQCKEKLKIGGTALIEIDPSQADEILLLVEAIIPNSICTIIKDLLGHDRVFKLVLTE